MKSILASGAASFTLHAGVVGAFVALAAAGRVLNESVDVGIRVVRQAGDPEMCVQQPRPEGEVEFERLEVRVELEHPMAIEDLVERPETRFDVEEDRPVPRPEPRPPVLDRPLRTNPGRIAPAAEEVDRVKAPPVEPAPAVTETAPSEIANPPPEYPALARRRGYEGSVVLAFEVLPDGSCGGVRVMESSGHDILDEAAARAVGGWRFKPATRDGRPVATSQRLRVTFRLKDGP